MYDEGRGVEQDATEAVRWYSKAAAQGYADAQVNLGLMYEKGRGVAQDHDEAARLFRAAAEQGNPLAQIDAGIMSLRRK